MISKGRRPQKGFHFGDSVGDSVGGLESPDFIIRIRTQTTSSPLIVVFPKLSLLGLYN